MRALGLAIECAQANHEGFLYVVCNIRVHAHESKCATIEYIIYYENAVPLLNFKTKIIINLRAKSGGKNKEIVNKYFI